MNELELFAGAGGGILGSMLLGHRTVCAVEYDSYARSVLLARQADGTFPPFPVWDDVRTFDGKPWRGRVDVVSGGFPCQDISAAGAGAGIDGERSGLWGQMARIIGEVRPRFVFVENSPMLTSRGLGRVLGDLAEMGFNARWGVISAADTGAPHLRERIWVLGYSASERFPQRASLPMGRSEKVAQFERPGSEMADALRERQQGSRQSFYASHSQASRKGQAGNAFDVCVGRKWPAEPGVGRVVDGMDHRTYRLKAIGNGQVPRVRAAAWRILSGE